MSETTIRQLLLVHFDEGPKGTACKVCKAEYAPKTNATLSAWTHHLATHVKGIADDKLTEYQKKIQATLAAVEKLQTARGEKKRKQMEASESAAKRPAAALAATSAAPLQQQKMHALFQIRPPLDHMRLLAKAIVTGGVSYRFVENPSFQELLRQLKWKGPLPTALDPRIQTMQEAAEMREALVKKLQQSGNPISIAIDGWTNVQHNKVTNVVILASGQAYYWCSIVNHAAHNDAQWLMGHLTPVLEELMDKHGLLLTGVALDNESVNGALVKLLLHKWPFLVHAPCAAHTLQLVVKDVLKSEQFQGVVAQLRDLLDYFDLKDNILELKAKQQRSGKTPLHLVKPCDTRWSSMLAAVERVLEIKPELDFCFSIDTIPNHSDFFGKLTSLRDFLEPFRAATNIIQSDCATLLDVYRQFLRLWHHIKEQRDLSAAKHLLRRWQWRTNRKAVGAAALLASEDIPASMVATQDAQQFIRSFGCAYLERYRLTNVSGPELNRLLLRQLSDFNGKVGVFNDFVAMKDALEGKDRADPRAVWRLYQEVELSRVALALLSIPASEAAVERAFSLQGARHSKLRNRTHDSTIQAEMFVCFNSRQHAPETFGSVAQMDENFDPAKHAAAFQLWEDAEQLVDEAVIDAAAEEEPEVIEDDAVIVVEAVAAPPERTLTAVKQVTHDFIDLFLNEHKDVLLSLAPGQRWPESVRLSFTDMANAHCKGGLSSAALRTTIMEQLAEMRAALHV